MPEGDKCIVCHDSVTSSQLHLKNGKKIGTNQIPEFCGQCHGIKFRDWKIGAHGKKVKGWSSETGKRVVCTTCHNPHIPKFEKLEAKNPPKIKSH